MLQNSNGTFKTVIVQFSAVRGEREGEREREELKNKHKSQAENQNIYLL